MRYHVIVDSRTIVEGAGGPWALKPRFSLFPIAIITGESHHLIVNLLKRSVIVRSNTTKRIGGIAREALLGDAELGPIKLGCLVKPAHFICADSGTNWHLA